MRFVIKNFFESLNGVDVQIVNLGGGFDTLYYYIRDNFDKFVYFDIDFPEQLVAKSHIILNNDKLSIKNSYIKDYSEKLIESDNFKMVNIS